MVLLGLKEIENVKKNEGDDVIEVMRLSGRFFEGERRGERVWPREEW